MLSVDNTAINQYYTYGESYVAEQSFAGEQAIRKGTFQQGLRVASSCFGRCIIVAMGLVQQPLLPAKLAAAQTSIQAGGDGVREGVEMMLTAMAEYLENGDTGGANGSQVHAIYEYVLYIMLPVTYSSTVVSRLNLYR